MAVDFVGTPIESGEINDILNKDFISSFRKNGYRRYKGIFLPARHSDFAERLENFEVRDDDVWVMSFPKTGTTWTQEMVWCIANDLDFKVAEEMLQMRFPFIDFSSLFDFSHVEEERPGFKFPLVVSDSVSAVEEIKSQRFIKTHLPWELLPRQIREGEKKPKIIYVCRNAKDTLISYYHHCILMEGYRGTFDDFFKLFINDSVPYAPFWSHIAGFYERRNEENFLFITYDEMRKDLASVVRRTGEFLGKNLTDEQVTILCDHLSFQSMKNNPSVNYEAVIEINRSFGLMPKDGNFMRSGTGGEWKGKMSDEQIAEMDAWIAEKSQGIDIWNQPS